MGVVGRNPLKLMIQAIGAEAGLVVGQSYKYLGENTPNHVYGTSGYDVKITRLEQSTYISGRQGEGKSTLMLNMALQDIEFGNKAIIVIDPHGDLAEDVLKRCSPQEAHRVTYFAPAETWQKQKPFGLNPFEWTDREDLHYKFDAVMKVFKHSWSTSFKVASIMQNTMETLARVLLEAYPNHQTTFFHAFLLTRRDGVGESYRRTILDLETDNPALRYNLEQWQDDRKFIADTESTVHKVNHIVSDHILLNILSQAKSADCFDFRKLVAQKGVLIVNLKGLDDEGQRLIGSILLTQLVASAKRHGNTDRPCHLYVDEFYKFSTESFVEIINECRKNGLMVTIAHQSLAQLDEQALRATQNCGNVVCFRINPIDAGDLVKHFYGLTTDVFHEIPRYHAIVKSVQKKSAPEPNIVRIKITPNKPNSAVVQQIIERSERLGTPLQEVRQRIEELNPKIEFFNISSDKFKESLIPRRVKDSEPTPSNEPDKKVEKDDQQTPKGRRKSRFGQKAEDDEETSSKNA